MNQTSITEDVLIKIYKVLTSFLAEKHKGTNYSTKSLSIAPGCGTADNYLSVIYAVKVQVSIDATGELYNYDFILKSQISDDGGDPGAKYFWNAVFCKENGFYSELLPEIGKACHMDMGPKLYKFYTEGDEYSCLMLDNLLTLGYTVGESKAGGLSLPECQALMKHLAKLHASSLIMESKIGCPLPEKYEICGAETMFIKDLGPMIGEYYRNSYLGIANALESKNQDLSNRMYKLHKENDVWNRLCEIILPGRTSFSTLCHGDPRPANIFFKKSGDKLELDLKFVDFQLVRYASPITDLQYAFYMGTSKELRSKHLQALLKIYFDEFQSVLTSNPDLYKYVNPKAKAWTLECLNTEFKDNYIYGYLIGTALLPLLLTEKEKNAAIRSMTQEMWLELVQKNWKQFISDTMLANSVMGNVMVGILEEMVEFNVI